METTNTFIEGIKKNLDSELSVTENGALTHATVGGEGKNLVDFNFAVSAMRGWDATRIKDAYAKAYFENPKLAVLYWAFCMDCRGGLGERRLSRIIFDWLIENQIDVAKSIVHLIPTFGRWDSLIMLIDTKLSNVVTTIIADQLTDDLENLENHKSISLCAKWCPSQNTSSATTRERGKKIQHQLGISPRQYRKMLSKLRAELHIVERDMSSNNWSNINYNNVPSKANLLYKDAFLKHDKPRRDEYLSLLANGDSQVKINTATAFPCDIVHKYMINAIRVGEYDATLEEMWKHQKDYIGDKLSNTLVVADTSGSMLWYPHNGITAWEVAQSMAIYMSERANDAFRDKYIVFSKTPRWIDFSKCESLRDKLTLSRLVNDCSNTDFYATMMLVLDTGIANNLTQEEMPSTIVVISDMEFDAVYDSDEQETLMTTVTKKFAEHGYKLPKMVWWNVEGGNNRGGNNIPMQSNANGNILVSGFSPAICDMMFSNKTSPYEVLLEKLNSPRYAKVAECLERNK